MALAFSFAPLASTQQKISSSAASPTPRALVNQYCVACHNQKVKTAGVALDAIDPQKVSPDSAVWEKVLRKVSAGQMPPAGMPHASPAATADFTKWLGDALDQAAAGHPNPGDPT
ncbi:MAG: hypothetical protein M3Z23_09945, partial [Acidobacteriota bacterium]|nr:hypothetical protein [Acidobacteriota bacterium]